MAETLTAESYHSNEDSLSDDEFFAEFANTNETEAVLQQLEAEYAGRVFNYKSYSRTVTDLYFSCPAFEAVLANGIEYTRDWLEMNDQLPEDKPVEDGSKKSQDEPSAPKDDSQPSLAEAPAKDSSASESSRQDSEAKSADSDGSAYETKQVVDAPAAVVSAPAIKPAELPTPTTRAESNGGAHIVSPQKDVPVESMDSAPEIKPEPTAGAEIIIDNHVEHEQRTAVVPEISPDNVVVQQRDDAAESVGAVELKPIVATMDVIEHDLSQELVQPIELAESLSIGSREAELLESEPIEISSEIVAEEDGLVESEVVDVEHDTTQFQIDSVEVKGENETERFDDQAYPAFTSDPTAEELTVEDYVSVVESIERANVNDILEEHEAEPVAEMEPEQEVMNHEELVEMFDEPEPSVQEIIEITTEMTGEEPESPPLTINENVITQVSTVVRKIQILETARTAEQCHDALTEIRQELTNLLILLGYDNAEAIAEQLVQQHDTASLKRYLALLIRQLESRRSESTIARQIKNQPSHKRFGMHVVGRVVMLGGRSVHYST